MPPLRPPSPSRPWPDETHDAITWECSCYHAGVVRQLITRVDDDLHARLKARAASEGRSLNDLVVELLVAAVDDPRAALRRRLARRSLLVTPGAPRPVPERDVAIASTRGAGSAAGDALADERAGG